MYDKLQKENKLLTVLAIVFTGLIVVVTALVFLLPKLTEAKDVKIPDVSNMSVLDAETETAEFIESFGLHEINAEAVRHCKTRFIEINQQILVHIQKIQSYGYNLGPIYGTVQLEIATLYKELSLLS